MNLHPYAYLLGSLFWLSIWFVLFALLRHQRRAMVWTGLWLAPGGPINAIFNLQDYWHPPYVFEFQIGTWHLGGPEDLILTFVLTGICAGLFEFYCALRAAPPLPSLRGNNLWRLALWPTLVLIVLLAGIALGLPSIGAMFISIGLVSAILLAPFRRWWLPLAGLSLAFALTYWIIYLWVFVPLFPSAFATWWKLENTCGLRWVGVPIEEVIWAGLTFVFAGPYLRASLTQGPRPARRITKTLA